MSTDRAPSVERREERDLQPVRPPFELLASKLRGPVPGRTAVPRTDLVGRLIGSDETPIVAIFAAPGYGKTTLIAQWEAADPRPFAWVGIDERDNDAVVLLTYIAQALDRVQPLPSPVFEALSSPGAGVETVLIPRVAAALSRMTSAAVLVLDDVHELENEECLDAIAALIANLSIGSQIVLSGRGNRAYHSPGCARIARRWTSALLISRSTY